MNRGLLLSGQVLLLSLFSLVPAASAQNTLFLEEQVNPSFSIKVTASDGLDTSTVKRIITDPFTGSVVATPQGVLNPELFVSSIVIEIPETTVNFVFGTAEILATMTFSAYYEWQPNLGIDIGFTERKNTGELTSFWLTGEFEALGETIPFDFELSDYLGDTRLRDGINANPWWHAPSADTFMLTGDRPITYLSPLSPLSSDLGSLGGVDFHLDVAWPLVESLTFVPEPTPLASGLAALCALGLVRSRSR